MCNATSNFSKSREWGMGGGYDITNRGKDEEITHSTHISRSMGEGIREEWNIYLSIRFLGRGGENVQVLRTFSPIIGNKMFQFSWNIYVPYQKRTYFRESICYVIPPTHTLFRGLRKIWNDIFPAMCNYYCLKYRLI